MIFLLLSPLATDRLSCFRSIATAGWVEEGGGFNWAGCWVSCSHVLSSGVIVSMIWQRIICGLCLNGEYIILSDGVNKHHGGLSFREPRLLIERQEKFGSRASRPKVYVKVEGGSCVRWFNLICLSFTVQKHYQTVTLCVAHLLCAALKTRQDSQHQKWFASCRRSFHSSWPNYNIGYFSLFFLPCQLSSCIIGQQRFPAPTRNAERMTPSVADIGAY